MIYRLLALTLLLCCTGIANAQVPGTTNCSNSVQGNNSGAQTNNCGNLYLRPAPLPNIVYQDGREIANVDTPMTINADGTCSIAEMYNTKVADIQEHGPPLELDGHYIEITAATGGPMFKAKPNGEMVSNVFLNVKCKIIK